MTGSPELWALAANCDVVPMPPDQTLAHMLAGWWSMPRMFGCAAASRSSSWIVVMPSPSIWCGPCALEVFHHERRCSYCHANIRKINASNALVFELRTGVKVLGRAHAPCSQRAQRATGESG